MAFLRSFAIVGANTFGSRILGFVRDILIARALGTGIVADAWVVAFRFPDLFRRLFVEGAFNAAFVPLFVRAVEDEGPQAARSFAEDVMAVILVALLVVTILAEVAMPLVMHVLAPGFPRDGAAFPLAVDLTRLTFPYLLLVSLAALAGGLLNALGRFALTAAAPVLLNLVLIAAVVFGARAFGDVGHALAWGVAVAGAVQAGLLFVGTARAGFSLRLRLPRLTPAVTRFLRLGVPGLIAGGATQINLLIGTMIATAVPGAPATLYYADRVYQLPTGLIGGALGVVLLPELARRLSARDAQAAADGFNRALELALLLALPAAAALIVIAVPIATMLFERGAFAAEDTRRTAYALMAFSAGLPAFVLIKVFQPGFFAREDTATPLVLSVLGIGANVVLSLVFLFAIGWGGAGIALATSAAGWLTALLLGARLLGGGGFALDARLLRVAPRIVLATVVMAGALYVAEPTVWPGAEATTLAKLTGLGLMVTGGLVMFGGACVLLGVATPAELRRLLRKGDAPGPLAPDADGR